MLNYFDRRKLEVELERLRNSIVDDVLTEVTEKRNSIDKLESTLGGAKEVLCAVETLQLYMKSCDRQEILDRIDD